jgi:hypothetical protein
VNKPSVLIQEQAAASATTNLISSPLLLPLHVLFKKALAVAFPFLVQALSNGLSSMMMVMK